MLSRKVYGLSTVTQLGLASCDPGPCALGGKRVARSGLGAQRKERALRIAWERTAKLKEVSCMTHSLPKPLNQSRILVTGSSGFIGSHLVARLVAAGHHVVGLDIRPPHWSLPNTTIINCDIRNADLDSIPQVDAIYNLAAVHTTPGHKDHEYYDTNISGAQLACSIAMRDNVSEITFISSISIYGPCENLRDERSTPNPESAYGKSKLFAEEIHKVWARGDSERKLTIARPAVVFGKGEGGNFTRMAKLLRFGLFIFPGRRDTVKSCIYVEDLIDLIQFSQNQNGGINIVNCCYPECPTLETIVRTLKQLYFPRAVLIDIPVSIVMIAAAALASLKGIGFGVHPERVNKLTKSTYVFPQWASDQNFFAERSFEAGIIKWAKATDRKFI